MIRQTLGHYRIESKLGEGGMGVVYRAHDEQLDRDVAIKVLPAGSFRDATARARLLREARTASKLNHPHICTIHEVGEADGQAYIAMELVEGQPLSARLAGGALPIEQVLRYGLQLADAVAHAHQRGIIHRDLKSANVIITPEGRAKVLDFGLAKRLGREELAEATTQTMDSLTGPGAVVGTLAYMAPEQLRGQPADARSDIWALGVVLYEMAAGQRPFRGQTGFELSSAILSQPPPPLPPGPSGALPAELRAVIERCLEKEPAQRYQRSEEVRAALEAVQSGAPLPAWPAWKYALSRRRWLALATALVIIVAVLAALDVGGLRGRLLGGAAAPQFHSLAVLPVANLSGDPQQEYFTDGMTDALITDLSKIGALKVISRTSVMQYKGVKKPLPEIARDLKVDTILEASVVREAGRVRVTAQLIEAATDRHLWAESYERELTSILALQSEVARAVARTVRARLRPQEEARLAGARAVNPATYEAYLKGMFYLNKSTPADIQKSMAYFQEAVEKDPADPLAYAGLAMGYIEIAHGADPTEDALQRAKAAARTALKLDDTLAETLLANGFVKGYYDWNWEEAQRDIQRALDINPSLAEAYYHRSWFHALFGRMKEAIEDHKRAQELDPFNPYMTAWLGELYRWERRYDEAAAEALKSIKMDPKFPVGHYVLGVVYQDQGKYDQAIAAIQKAAEADPDWRWALGPTYVAAGRSDEARKLLAELNRQKVIPWTAFWRVPIYAALGENDEAFRWLNYRHPHTWIPWVRVWHGPGFERLRNDPRFPDQLRRTNLPPVKPSQ
jgi:TolB-like protein/tRNA A-37 threonylcarbamoyl transferase component Bud32/Flp pilus assembly protein TadD